MTKAGKIGLMFPPEREVYKLRRMALGSEPLPCIRCGNNCYNASGSRKAVIFTVRDRGTSWKNAEDHGIHQGCVPSGDAPLAIRARSLRSSQVRTEV